MECNVGIRAGQVGSSEELGWPELETAMGSMGRQEDYRSDPTTPLNSASVMAWSVSVLT